MGVFWDYKGFVLHRHHYLHPVHDLLHHLRVRLLYVLVYVRRSHGLLVVLHPPTPPNDKPEVLKIEEQVIRGEWIWKNMYRVQVNVANSLKTFFGLSCTSNFQILLASKNFSCTKSKLLAELMSRIHINKSRH